MNPPERTQYPQSQLPLCLHPRSTYSQRVTCLSSREEVHVARAGAQYLLPRKRVSVEHGLVRVRDNPSLLSSRGCAAQAGEAHSTSQGLATSSRNSLGWGLLGNQRQSNAGD